MSMTNKLGAEFIGTFWLVLGGCGSVVLAATFPDTGIGFVGGWAMAQLWLFWVAPIVGAALAGLCYRWLGAENK